MSSDSPLVLVVEDDAVIRRLTCAALSASQYRFVEAETGRQALAEVAEQHPDVMLLDLGLPDMSGLDVIRQLSNVQHPPIVVFSAGGSVHNEIAALEAGAVDYIAKPFVMAELLSRLRSALHGSRRAGIVPASHFTFGDVSVDLLHHRVTVADREVPLSSRELRVLTTFLKNAGRLMTYRFIIDEISEPDDVPNDAEVRTIVSSLRHKLEHDPARPHYLFAEMGVGYRFRDE